MPNSQAVFEVLGPRLKAGLLFHVTSPKGARGILADGAIKPNLNYRYPKTFLQPFGPPADIRNGWICLFDWRDQQDEDLLGTKHWCTPPCLFLRAHEPISVIFQINPEALVGHLRPNGDTNGFETWCTCEVPLQAMTRCLVYNIYMPEDFEAFDPRDRAGIEAALTRLDEEAQRISSTYRASVAFHRARAALQAEVIQEAALLSAVDKHMADRAVHPAVHRAWGFFKREYHPFTSAHRCTPREVPLTWPATSAPVEPGQLARAQALAAECDQIEGIFQAGGDVVIAYAGDDALFEESVTAQLGFVWFLRAGGDIGCVYDAGFEDRWMPASWPGMLRWAARLWVQEPDKWVQRLRHDSAAAFAMECLRRRWPFQDISQVYLDVAVKPCGGVRAN